jgi:hypothetical protein
MTRTLSARLSWLRRDIESAIDGASHCPAVLARLRRIREEIVAAQIEAGEPPSPVTCKDRLHVADGDVRDLRGVV